MRIVDAESQRILDRNGADCELSGFARDAMLGCDSRQFWPQAGARGGSRAEASPEAWATGVSRTQSVPFMTASGRTLTVDCSRRIVAYQGRRYEIVIYRDAAERLAGEEARREAESEEGGWARTCRRAGGRIRDAVGRLNRIVRIESTESTGSLPPILDTGLSAERPDDDARR